MIYATMENFMRDAVENTDNTNTDYSINWNFVDADTYAECSGYFKSDTRFYEMFDEIAETINTERAEEARCESQYA